MRPLPALILLLSVACGSPPEGFDAGPDAGRTDAAIPEDAGRDGGRDAGPDGGPEVSEDAGPPEVDAGPDGLRPVEPPPPPVFDDTIETISIAVRTADVLNAGTNDPIEVCVNPTTCFALDTPDIDDRQRGLIDQLHFGGLALQRSEITEVTLRSGSPPEENNDRWTPTCLELRFDGEPVYCNDDIGAHIGTGPSAGEVASWTDPAGLHEACTTCWPETLTHGPVQGAHEAELARLWVRADASRRVGLRMAEGALTEDSPHVAWAIPSPDDDFSARIEVPGLEPETTYSFRFEVDGDLSQPIRTLRTPPAPGSISPVRVAIGSCSRYVDQPTVGALHAQAPDVFLFVGDIHYANSQHIEAHRWRYRRFRSVPERAALLADVPTLASWDDHDFVGNNSNGICEGRDEAVRAFTEYWGNPSAGDGVTPGVFFRHRFGPIEVFALDCRMHRPDVGDGGRRCDLDPSPPALDVADGPLGAAQTSWALDALESSDAPFKFVSCGSRFTPAGSIDSWRSFPEARDEFLSALDDRGIEGVVLVTGDIHRSEIRRVPRANGYDLPELTSSPLANSVSNCGSGDSDRQFCLDGETSFVTVDVDIAPADPELTVRVHGADGGVRYEETILRSSLQ